SLTPQNIGASWVHTFNASSLLHVEFGRALSDSGSANTFVNGGKELAAAVGFDPAFCCSFHSGRSLVPNLSVTQFFSGGETYNNSRNSDLWQYKVNYSLVRGDHQFKLGGEFNKLSLATQITDHESDFDPSSTGDPRNLGTTGSALASWLLNVPIGAARR